MPHDIRPRDTKGTRSVLVDHELSGVIVGQTLATAPEAYRAPAREMRTVAEHHAIHEALAARDSELAAARTAAHIDSAWTERRHRRFT
jgi:DNA-binding GntR family transcriptional regulator